MTITINAATEHAQRLLEAAANGDLATIKEFSDDIDNTITCKSGCTLLHWAAGSGQQHIVEYLLLLKNSNKFSIDEPVVRGKRAQNRTPLHYACRNGHLACVQQLVEKYGANVNARAKHGVTPLMLAVWQNHLTVCQYLVPIIDKGDKDIKSGNSDWQLNNFQCGLVHWLGICPVSRANGILDTAEYLYKVLQPVSSTNPFHEKQTQGHTALHKAAWGGHLDYCRYLHEQHQMWDDQIDLAGNYAADLADMYVNSSSGSENDVSRHVCVANYLRRYCSPQLKSSCQVIGIICPVDYQQEKEMDSDDLQEYLAAQYNDVVRPAYLRLAKSAHPDHGGDAHEFDGIRTAHEYFKSILLHDKSSSLDADFRCTLHTLDNATQQFNPCHSLPKLLSHVSLLSRSNSSYTESSDTELVDDTNLTEDDFFKARLLAVLFEYGDKGLDLSNVKKKWNQVWPDIVFPETKTPLSKFLTQKASDVIELRDNSTSAGGKDCIYVHARNLRRQDIVGDA